MSDQASPPPGPPPPTEPMAPVSYAPPSKDEMNMAMLCHLLGLFTWVLGPLIIWLLKRDTSPFVDDHGKEALNFQITLTIAYFVAGILMFVVIGCFVAVALLVFELVVIIQGAMAASKGEPYRYPVALRLVN